MKEVHKYVTSFVIRMAHLQVAMLSRIMFKIKLTSEIAPNVKAKYPEFLISSWQSSFCLSSEVEVPLNLSQLVGDVSSTV